MGGGGASCRQSDGMVEVEVEVGPGGGGGGGDGPRARGPFWGRRCCTS